MASNVEGYIVLDQGVVGGVHSDSALEAVVVAVVLDVAVGLGLSLVEVRAIPVEISQWTAIALRFAPPPP
jgi:hypothetical protein